jgi:hypothetical protein
VTIDAVPALRMRRYAIAYAVFGMHRLAVVIARGIEFSPQQDGSGARRDWAAHGGTLIGWWVAMGKAARATAAASLFGGGRNSCRLSVAAIASALTLVVVLGCLAASATAATIVDLGPGPAEPLAVNAQQEVLLSTGLWVSGTVRTPSAPASDPTAYFTPGGAKSEGENAGGQEPEALSDAGLVVGSANTGARSTVPAYWASGTSSTFTELSLSGLMVNGQSAVGGELMAVDAAGEAVGAIWDQAVVSGDATAADYAGLFVPAVGGVPAGAPQAVSSVDGTQIYSLFGISASYEAAANYGDCYCGVLINRQTQTATQTDLTHTEGTSVGWADNGTMSGYLYPGDPEPPELRLPDGTLTTLSAPSGDNVLLGDVNDSGQTVGTIAPSNGPGATGTVWDSSGNPTSLLSEVSNDAGWSELGPTVINDQGDIVGIGILNGSSENFLISAAGPPTPPVVNSTGDGGAINPSVRGCNTGNTVTGSGGAQVPQCTLRAAIETENAGNASTKTITFDIPGTAPGAIKLGSLLPPLTEAGTVIDGGSQPSGRVQILGPGESSAAPTGAAGCLDVQAADVTIEGLDLGNCQVGIELQTPGKDAVYDNLIGVAVDGETKTPCNYGVWISSSPDDTVGGTAVADRNVISADGTGVLIYGSGSTGDVVQGNLIGTDSSGSVFVPDTYGVEVLDASHDTIGAGGVAAADAGTPPGNVIDASAGAANFAVAVLGVSAVGTDDVVGGNLIGTDASGSRIDLSGASNAGPGYGVVLAGFVVGDTVGDGNVIAGATGAEVLVDSVHAHDNTISGDQVGSSRSGKVALPSTSARGILVAGANATAIANNAVTGQQYGIEIAGRTVSLPAGPAGGTVPGTSGGTGITNASVSGNVVGPLPGGTSVPTDAQQVGILDFDGNTDVIGPNNQVSWDRVGVGLREVHGADLKGNLIGTNRAGTVALPDGAGMLISGSKGVAVGVVGHPDTISGNTDDDLVIADSDLVIVRAELIGTTKLGNAAVKPFSGKVPWGDRGLKVAVGGTTIELSNRVGIEILGGASATQPTVIGGSKPGQGVVVSGITGADSAAIELKGPTLLIRDKIGVGQNGTSAVPNGGTGVSVYEDHASDSEIESSTIAHNAGAGVVVYHADKVLVLRSLMFDNHKGGIDVDSTFGNAPFAPELRSASDVSLTRGGKKFVGIGVVVKVDVPGSQRGDVEFFATPTCEAGGAGKKYLGEVTLSQGHHDKTLVLIKALEAVGTAITATQSTEGNGTSRFSTCAILAPAK